MRIQSLHSLSGPSKGTVAVCTNFKQDPHIAFEVDAPIQVVHTNGISTHTAPLLFKHRAFPHTWHRSSPHRAFPHTRYLLTQVPIQNPTSAEAAANTPHFHTDTPHAPIPASGEMAGLLPPPSPASTAAAAGAPRFHATTICCSAAATAHAAWNLTWPSGGSSTNAHASCSMPSVSTQNDSARARVCVGRGQYQQLS